MGIFLERTHARVLSHPQLVLEVPITVRCLCPWHLHEGAYSV